MKPVSHYIVVSDMQKALAFYSQILECKPDHIEDRYSYFDIDGFYFGLLNKNAEDRPIVVGNNSTLCFLVDDLQITYDRLKSIVPYISPDFLTLPNVRLFEIKDHDGNLTEIFELKK